MYLPPVFASDDPNLAFSIIEQHPFGILIDPEGPSATHLPLLVGRANGEPNRLRGHVARANPASALGGKNVMAVFSGPHAYVSPLWYEEPNRQVPTWNYVVVHVWGRVELVDRAGARTLLEDLCRRFEGPDGYRPSTLAAEFFEELLDDIVAFEVRVERAVAKLKLSQNRSASDRRRVEAGLNARGSPEDQALLDWMVRIRG